MDNSGDKKENNSFSVPSYSWGKQPSLLKCQAVITLLHSAITSAVRGQMTLQTLGVFTLNFADFLYFSFHTAISSSHHTYLSLARSQRFPQTAQRDGQLRSPGLPPAVPITDRPHCSYHLSLFALWVSLILGVEVSHSQWPTQFHQYGISLAFPRLKLENNDQK